MKNIFDKLHKASEEAAPVIKGDKVPGMHFNPLEHDSVQKVAMAALRKHKLYPVCTYKNQVSDNFIFIECNMKIYDVDEPNQFVEIDGCSAMGKLDKFGSGNAMSYARKYAFLNALNLKTGLDNDDGVEAKPFAKKTAPIKQNTKSTNVAATDWINQMQSVAKHSKSQLYFEKNLTPIRDEYKDDLTLIATDPIEQLRVDTEYNKLKSQIQSRGTNVR
jgi:hypothetical protein